MFGRDETVQRALAGVLGLERWSAGANSIRGPDGSRDLWVDHLWIFFGWPSFELWWYFAGVGATTCGENKAPVGRVAWLPETDVHRRRKHRTRHGVAADVPTDAFAAAVNSVQLLGVDCKGLSLDGIGYSFWVDGIDVSGEFRFDNPQRADLIAVERAAFDLGRRLQQATGSDPLRDCLETWDEYRPKERRK